MKPPLHTGTRALLYHVAIIALAAGLVAALMWANEPWQRPLRVIRVADATWLAIAILGFATGAAAWPIRGLNRWGWAWRAAASAAVCTTILTSFLHMRRTAAVEALLDHDEVMGIVTPGFSRPKSTPSWFDDLRQDFAHGIRTILGISKTPSGTGLNTEVPPDAYDHFLETCRWPTRRAFIQEILGNESRARLATHHWHRLFPAVIGQDVTLARRSELLDWLDGLATSASAHPTCRDAAAFWMALIVLTDADAFGDWGDRTIQLMLESNVPPMSLTGDVWMCALDLLIALTPEENHAELAAPLTRDPMLVRRATRQRVRGMQHHARAITREIESLEQQWQHRAATAIWFDLMRMAKITDGQKPVNEIHAWLTSTMERWLMHDSDVVLEYFQGHHYFNHGVSGILLDGVLDYPLPDASRKRLAAKARAILESVEHTPPEHSSGFPDECMHALLIATLLDNEERIAIHNQVAMMLVKWIPEWLSADRAARSELSQASDVLQIVMDDLEPKIRDTLNRTLIEWAIFNHDHRRMGRFFHEAVVVLDTASENPILSEAEKIAVGAHRNRMRGETPRYSPEAVEDFIRILVTDEKPTHLGFWFHFLQRRLQHTRSTAGDLEEDQIRFFAVLNGIIGPEHLPEDMLAILRTNGTKQIQHLMQYPETWDKWMLQPEFVRALLADINLTKHRDYHRLIGHLKNHPPQPEIRRMIVQFLLRHADLPDQQVRRVAFHWLLVFSDWFAEDERAEFRKRFHHFFHVERPSLATWAEHCIHPYSTYWGAAEIHRGEQIPWRDDALSAAYSWSSEIHHELAIFPWEEYSNPSIFRHLHASASWLSPPGWGGAKLRPAPLDSIASDRVFHDPFPSPPYQATAWQLAREMHLRRPDLKFPDRPIFRPHGERVHFHYREVALDP